MLEINSREKIDGNNEENNGIEIDIENQVDNAKSPKKLACEGIEILLYLGGIHGSYL